MKATSLRSFREVGAGTLVAMGVVAVISVAGEDPGPRRTRLWVLAATSFGLALIQAVRAIRTPEDAIYTGGIDHLPPAERLRRLKRIGPLGIGALLILLVWCERGLWQLHTGQAESVEVWSVVAMIYDLFGTWAAASVLPALLVVTIWGLRAQWVRAKRELAEENRPAGVGPG